jgi:hypothetical protein
MKGEIDPYDPYGGGGRAGGRGLIRSRPVGLKAVAAIGAAQWIGKRVATRLTPIFLILLALLGVPLAFWGGPALIIAIGAGLTIITYATQRHVTPNDRIARQWAIRTGALPIVGTGWVLLWHVMHRLDMDVINQTMLIAYWLFGCLAWAWLYVAHFIGAKVAWERAQRDFGPVARQVGIAGAAIVGTAKTAVGSRRTVDVRATGQTASAIARNGELAEKVAAAEGLAPGKVRVQASATHAGHIEISTWLSNPWSKPVAHPLAPDFPLTRVAPIGSFEIGKDPETEKPLSIEIVNNDGGVHWVFIAGTRGGKTNLINNIVEHLTRARDAQNRPLVRITMIDILKGMKDAANWAPAVHRVFGGPKSVHGALAALQRAVDLITERAELNGRRGRSKHVPTAEEPVELIIIDEASFLMTKRTPEGRRAIELVNGILKAGASELVILIIASQRAVMEHLGSGDVKANAFGIAVLPVRRAIEQTNIIPDWRDRGMPDMSKYGDGAKGTVLITLNDEWSAGRTYELHDVMTIRKISTSRVLPGNESMIVADAGAAPSEIVLDSLKRAGLGNEPLAKLIAADPLVSEPPADGVDGPDVPADLAFDDDAEMLPPAAPGDIVPRLGDRPASKQRPAAPVAHPDPRTPDVRPDARPAGRPGRTSGPRVAGQRKRPDAAHAQDVRASGVRASGPGAEDDEAVEAALSGSASNVRAIDPDAPPWVEASDPDAEAMAAAMVADAEAAGELDDEADGNPDAGRTDGMDTLDSMAVVLDRMQDVTAWAAAREASRTPAERAALVDAWRERTWREDQAVKVPEPVLACLAALANARGMTGFTRGEARDALVVAEVVTVNDKGPDGMHFASYLRVLTSQGHLEHLRGVGPNGADIYRLGARHRRTG